jgi:hypothetical protein
MISFYALLFTNSDLAKARKALENTGNFGIRKAEVFQMSLLLGIMLMELMVWIN